MIVMYKMVDLQLECIRDRLGYTTRTREACPGIACMISCLSPIMETPEMKGKDKRKTEERRGGKNRRPLLDFCQNFDFQSTTMEFFLHKSSFPCRGLMSLCLIYHHSRSGWVWGGEGKRGGRGGGGLEMRGYRVNKTLTNDETKISSGPTVAKNPVYSFKFIQSISDTILFPSKQHQNSLAPLLSLSHLILHP